LKECIELQFHPFPINLLPQGFVQPRPILTNLQKKATHKQTLARGEHNTVYFGSAKRGREKFEELS